MSEFIGGTFAFKVCNWIALRKASTFFPMLASSTGNIFLLVAQMVAPITLLALLLGLAAQRVLSGLQTAPELMLRLIP